MSGGDIAALQQRLADGRARREQADRLARRLHGLAEEVRRLETERAELLERYEAEAQDVERLQGWTVTRLATWLFKDERLELAREEAEMLEAKLRLDEATDACDAAVARRTELERELADLSRAEGELEDLRAELEQALVAAGGATGGALARLGEEVADLASQDAELEEAVRAGERALEQLAGVAGHLESARAWGVWDMVGGGMIATAIKHGKVRDAQARLSRARESVRSFDRELRDVQRSLDMQLDLSGMLGWGDYLFDGLFVDWMMQSRIQEALKQVRTGEGNVAGLLAGLRRERENLQRRRQELEARRRSLLDAG